MATMTLDQLVSQLAKVYGKDLRAVVLYGSAAAGEHIAKRSDYNVLVIVDQLTMGHLRAEAAVARAWQDSGNPAPLTLTTSEWRASGDIFPMEYADILERHVARIRWEPGVRRALRKALGVPAVLAAAAAAVLLVVPASTLARVATPREGDAIARAGRAVQVCPEIG